MPPIARLVCVSPACTHASLRLSSSRRTLLPQGLLNAVAYGMSVSIRTELVKQFPFLRRVCPGRCCGREESDEDQWASNPVASASQGLQADASGDNAL